jgi:hypothetical protein
MLKHYNHEQHYDYEIEECSLRNFYIISIVLLSKKDIIGDKIEEEKKTKVIKKTNLLAPRQDGATPAGNTTASGGGKPLGGFFAIVNQALANKAEISNLRTSDDIEVQDPKEDEESKEVVLTTIEEWLSDGSPSNIKVKKRC